MPNFSLDILKAVGDQDIIAISVGKTRGGWGDNSDHELGQDPVAWNEAVSTLNYIYNDGFGGQDCHDVYVWTKTHVYFVHEYDGATSVESVPRNPSKIHSVY